MSSSLMSGSEGDLNTSGAPSTCATLHHDALPKLLPTTAASWRLAFLLQPDLEMVKRRSMGRLVRRLVLGEAVVRIHAN